MTFPTAKKEEKVPVRVVEEVLRENGELRRRIRELSELYSELLDDRDRLLAETLKRDEPGEEHA